MKTKFLASLVLLLLLAWPAEAAYWVLMGKLEDGGDVFFDADIQPVAYVDKQGATVRAGGLFTENYRIYWKGDKNNGTNVQSVFDTRADRTLDAEVKKWRDYKEGGDGMLFAAYLLRDYTKVMSGHPFVLKNQFLPKERAPLWPVDANGWKKAYERKDGSAAWVQTRSAILSQHSGEELPHVRVLVRREEVVEGQKEITFAYESYDPQKRTKVVLKSWDIGRKELPVDPTAQHPVLVLSKDAAIASVGYLVFVLDHEEVARRIQFAVGDAAFLVRDGWFVF